MKKPFVLICTLFFTIAAVFGQEVMEADKVMSKGSQTSISVEIEDIDSRTVENLWKDFAKKYTRSVKKDRKSKEWFADDAEISSINSSTPVDLYTKIESAGKVIRVISWVDLGTGFVNSVDHPDAYRGTSEMMSAFAHIVETEKVQMNLDDEEKTLKKMESELRKLESQKSNYERDIERAEEAIARAEENIKKNEKEQEDQQATIETQLEVIEDVKVKLNEMKDKKN